MLYSRVVDLDPNSFSFLDLDPGVKNLRRNKHKMQEKW